MKKNDAILADEIQKNYLSNLKDAVLSSYKQVFKIFCICNFGDRAFIYIFYKTNRDLIENSKNNVSTQIYNYINHYLEDSGYLNKFGSGILIEFDSDENVKKNYKGNYYYRLL